MIESVHLWYHLVVSEGIELLWFSAIMCATKKLLALWYALRLINIWIFMYGCNSDPRSRVCTIMVSSFSSVQCVRGSYGMTTVKSRTWTLCSANVGLLGKQTHHRSNNSLPFTSQNWTLRLRWHFWWFVDTVAVLCIYLCVLFALWHGTWELKTMLVSYVYMHINIYVILFYCFLPSFSIYIIILQWLFFLIGWADPKALSVGM